MKLKLHLTLPCCGGYNVAQGLQAAGIGGGGYAGYGAAAPGAYGTGIPCGCIGYGRAPPVGGGGLGGGSFLPPTHFYIFYKHFVETTVTQEKVF